MIPRTLFIWLLSCFTAYSQVDRQTYLDQRLQEFISLEITDDAEDWIEWLDQIYQNPWDINRVTEEELRSLHLVSEAHIQAFIHHRQEIGAFQNILEIQSITGWTEEVWHRVGPLLTIPKPRNTASPWWKRGTELFYLQRWDRSLPHVLGFTDQKYAGTPFRFQQRMRWQHPQDFSVGIVTEKDPGERSYLDYIGFHLAKQKTKGWVSQILGDFQIQFGQGLVWGAGFFVGKGGETIYSIRRGQGGLRPYTSIGERIALRGAAATYQWRQWYITGVLSYRKTDARIQLDSFFTSISTIGYHRTASEISQKNTLGVFTAGGDLHYRTRSWLAGMSLAYTRYEKEANPAEQLYNAYAFRGKQLSTLSGYYSYQGNGFQSFGEVARSSSGGIGWIQGLTAIPHPGWEMAMLYRRYDRHFHSVYGQAFGEYSRPTNEQGFYAGLKFLPKKGIQWTAFFDQFSHPWIRFQTVGPGHGQHVGLRWQNAQRDKAHWIFQGSWKLRTLFPGVQTHVENSARWQFAAQWIAPTQKRWNWHSRFLYNRQAKTEGWGIFQDVKFQYSSGEFKGRMGYFQTAGYAHRVYVFEPDVLMGGSFPAFYGRGWRGVGVWRQAVGPKLDFWARLAYLRVYDRPSVGSGLETTPGPEKWTLTTQVRYRM